MALDLSKFGLRQDNLPDTFGGFVPGRVVIIDGDAACYKVTQKCAKLKTAQQRLTTAIYEIMFLTKADRARVHLTPKGCFKNGRHLLLGAKPYQANRIGTPKPPQLEMLRSTATSLFSNHDKVEVFAHFDIEADDAVMMDAYAEPNAIVWSEDKDLNIVPCAKYDIGTGIIDRLDAGDRFGWIKLKTDLSTPKIIGHGTKFFWAQMLCGDTADNVKGILTLDGKTCGAVSAYEATEWVTSEPHMANLVINQYREIGQNPLPEAEALWLLRCRGDSAIGYIWSLELTERNKAFILDCYNRPYKLTQEEYNERQRIECEGSGGEED